MVLSLHIQFSSKARLGKGVDKEHKLAKVLYAVLKGALAVH